MKYKFFAIDLDGTLLKDDKTISARSLSAVSAAVSKGVRVCISTGRAWPGAKEAAALIRPNAPVITSNGAEIVDSLTGEILYECLLDSDEARRIYAHGQELDISQIVWCRDRLYGSRIDDYLLDYGRRFGKMMPVPVEDFDALNEEGILKILWYSTPEVISRAEERFGHGSYYVNTNVCTSMPVFLEHFSCEVSKAKAIEKVAGMYGIGREEIVAFGDGANDLPMLEYAALSVAMGNASDFVKSKAMRVAEDNEHDGVAKMIEALLEEAE